MSVNGRAGYNADAESEDFGITFTTKKYHGQNGRTSHDRVPEAPALEDPAEITAEMERPSTEEENGTKPVRPHAGHTISETELMRRRRLLDAHIFE